MSLYSSPSSNASGYSDATVVKQAQELQRELSQLSPSFFKVLSKSDLSNGNVLDLPSEFFKDYIPNEGSPSAVVDIHLLDGLEHECVMKYSFCGHNFHGEWKDLYLLHKLSVGDALVFHQIEDYMFMVFVLGGKMSGVDQSKISISSAFSTSIDISLNLPERARMLCASQKQFLHSDIKGLSSALVGAMIMQTISIVDEIKTANSTITLSDLERMGNTLRSFEDLGLEVGFLRVKVNKLVKLSRERKMWRAMLGEILTEKEKQDNALKERERVSKFEEFMEIVKSLNRKSHLLKAEFKNIVDFAW